MSENEVPCPCCGAALEIEATAPAGKVVRCPECGAGLILSGEKNRPLKLKEAPKPNKSGKKLKPRLSWGMGGAGFVLLVPAKS